MHALARIAAAAAATASASAGVVPPSSIGTGSYTYAYDSFDPDIKYELTSREVPGEFCDPSSPPSLSGYLGVSGSKYDERRDKRYFYWFFERRSGSLLGEDERPPRKEEEEEVPFVVWLNGGPGCSSLLGLLQENGPCLVNKDGHSTRVNPYSWTEVAHVLYLDQPADTGYSYGSDNDDDRTMVAEDAYYFLQSFFQSPEGEKYKDLPLYLTGESYAGHYIPAISHRIRHGNMRRRRKRSGEAPLRLNLSGLAIGNGSIDIQEQMRWFAEMARNNPHGIEIVDDEGYEAMKRAGEACSESARMCNEHTDGDHEKTFLCQKASACEEEFFKPLRDKNVSIYDISKPCIGPLCEDMTAITTFLNLDTTKETLGVPSDVAWKDCDDRVGEVWSSIDRVANVAPYISESLDDGLPVLIYAGDLDYICNYMGNRQVALDLEWEHAEEFRDADEHDWNDGGGLARSSHNLSFLQVYDAGHMVPQDQPRRALDMIAQFLDGEEF